jgi:NADH-quinone oxidoreductase subunit J
MFNENVLFYLFSILLVISAFMVIVSRHPVFSLLFLVASFLLSSFLLFLLECEFLALIFITIYVGAIAVLFLFAIMMLESKLSNLSKNTIKYVPVGFLFGGLTLFFVLQKISFFGGAESNLLYLNNYRNWYDLIDSTSGIEVFGQVLYSYFVLQILVAGLILLVVLVGVVYLTNTLNSGDKILEQSAFKQLARESKFLKAN